MTEDNQSGWITTTVGDLAQVKGGKRLPPGYKLQEQPTPFPYVRVTDMYNGGVREVDIRYVPAAAAQAIQNYRVRSDDIFISVAGTLGIVGRVSKRLDGANLTENADRLTGIKCDVDYLMQYLLSEPLQAEIDSIRTVGAQPKLALGRIKSFEVSLPTSMSEQARVSLALRDTDALTSFLERLIAKKQAIKEGMMQQLLTGKIRLSGFSGEWVAVAAGDIASFRGGSGFPIRYQARKSGAYPFFKVSDMNNEGNELFMRRANNYISADTRKLIGAVVMPRDAIVFAKVGAAVFLERKRILGQVSCIDNNMAAMTIDPSRADVRFVHYLLMNFSMSSLVSTTALPSLNGGQLRSIPVRLPSEIAEQRAIADLLADADAELDLLQGQLSKARLVKQGMMQELLTGRIRLDTAKATV